MNVFEQLSNALHPHRVALENSIGVELTNIRQLLEHANRISDLGKPDTSDDYKRLIRKGKFGETRLGGPRLGEYWLIQVIINNGTKIKSPNAVIRTTTGALLIAMLKETQVTALVNGAITLLPGEEMILEPEAEGEFDLTIHAIKRRIPATVPDAGYGVRQDGELDPRSPSGRHEPDRYLPEHGAWSGIDVPSEVEDTTHERYGGLAPEIAEPVGPQE